MPNPDGGPAFPTLDREEYQESETRSESLQHEDFRGMSLRDYFAGQALAGMSLDHDTAGTNAEWAYKIADAMLIQRREIDDDDA